MGRKKKATARGSTPSTKFNDIKEEHPGGEEEAQPPPEGPGSNSDEELKPIGDNGEHPAAADTEAPTGDSHRLNEQQELETEDTLPLPSPTLPLPPPTGRNLEPEGRGEQRGPCSELEHPAQAGEAKEQPPAPTSDSKKAPIRAAEGSASHEADPVEQDELKPSVIRGHLTEIEEAPVSPSVSATDSRIQQEEDEKQQQHQQQWLQQKKHFIVLTSAGKPVYSRHGDEDALAGLMALTTAMVSVVQDQGDTIQHVTAGTTTIVFLIKGPLYFVASSQLGEPVMVLQRQLEMLHLQIMLVVSSGLERILSRNPSYDARGMLEGMGVVLDKLIDNMQEDATHLLLGLQPLGNLAPPVRSSAMRALSEAVKASGAVYGLLLAAGGQAVAVERGKGSPSLDHRDVLLLDNFICCNPAFRCCLRYNKS
ncbi:trafficking protein Mon1-domain-containing protein [Dunaliella salina]|uniref:Vacuolar fusion protein MON1 homolog n=1 Tax=Dunaliella salina TaxID=3046 RepID=A0ABQ7H954_DUNSA|nr:trafficking protein Mon1-domain-containing protein [Dunaliella salina]|eukprot:KAF5843386.1 trafficking protein Mon1-domain-containing protein [Dunaliella salina]